MSRSSTDLIFRAALVIGGGYLLYRLFNSQPAVLPGTAQPAAPQTVQQSLDTALTNLATGVTGIVG